VVNLSWAGNSVQVSILHLSRPESVSCPMPRTLYDKSNAIQPSVRDLAFVHGPVGSPSMTRASFAAKPVSREDDSRKPYEQEGRARKRGSNVM
jgi:hypothetical protein